MQPLYELLADITFFTHLMFIVFSIFGGLLCFRWKWLAWLHLPALTWAVLIWFFRWSCPLTPLENYFRARAGLGIYQTGFMARYIYPLIYINTPGGAQRIFLGSLLITGNVLVYIFLCRIHWSD